MGKFCIGLAIVLLSLSAQAADIKQQIQTTVEQFLAGATRNDAAVHDAFWADELIYTSSNGTRFDKATLMKDVRDSGPVADIKTVPQYSAENMHIWLHQDVAVVTFVLVATAPDGQQQRYLNSGTLILRDGRWQAVNWQATHKKA